MRMSQTTTDNSQMLSRLSHVDEVQYKRWNHYKVHDTLNTRVTFRGAILIFFPWSQVSFKKVFVSAGDGGVGLKLERLYQFLYWFWEKIRLFYRLFCSLGEAGSRLKFCFVPGSQSKQNFQLVHIWTPGYEPSRIDESTLSFTVVTD